MSIVKLDPSKVHAYITHKEYTYSVNETNPSGKKIKNIKFKRYNITQCKEEQFNTEEEKTY